VHHYDRAFCIFDGLSMPGPAARACMGLADASGKLRDPEGYERYTDMALRLTAKARNWEAS